MILRVILALLLMSMSEPALGACAKDCDCCTGTYTYTVLFTDSSSIVQWLMTFLCRT